MSDPIAPASAVLVSGGSKGLGLAIVADLLAAGTKVATFSRSATPELGRLAEEHGDALVTEALDVTDTAAVKEFISRASDQLGPLDGLINNAAVGQDSLFVQTSAERVAGIIETNLTAPLLLTRLFLRHVLARSGGARIVMVTSICAQRGYSGLVAYAATKGGLEAATRTLAREMHGRVLINAIAPGFFASEMSSVLGTEELGTIARRTPSGHLVEPSDVLPVVRTLLLERTNMNGQVIAIDGGASI
jgi:3-oxoacyl-[acyl-carrier protein] reductase